VRYRPKIQQMTPISTRHLHAAEDAEEDVGAKARITVNPGGQNDHRRMI
jgi:hypothetical protein